MDVVARSGPFRALQQPRLWPNVRTTLRSLSPPVGFCSGARPCRSVGEPALGWLCSHVQGMLRHGGADSTSVRPSKCTQPAMPSGRLRLPHGRLRQWGASPIAWAVSPTPWAVTPTLRAVPPTPRAVPPTTRAAAPTPWGVVPPMHRAYVEQLRSSRGSFCGAWISAGICRVFVRAARRTFGCLLCTF